MGGWRQGKTAKAPGFHITQGARILGVAAVAVAIAIITMMIARMYRRAQRDPEITAAQRLDFAGKLMGGLFSMLSLVGGTALGLLIAK